MYGAESTASSDTANDAAGSKLAFHNGSNLRRSNFGHARAEALPVPHPHRRSCITRDTNVHKVGAKMGVDPTELLRMINGRVMPASIAATNTPGSPWVV
jgi:hypothetical protein